MSISGVTLLRSDINLFLMPLAVVTFFLFQEDAALSRGAERRSPEHSAVDVLKNGFVLYQSLHEGTFPTNWRQLEEVIDIQSLNLRLSANGAQPVQGLYTFVRPPVELVSAGTTGKVILVQTAPIRHDERIGRFMILTNSLGISYTWMPEDLVQSQFARAGAPMPVLDKDSFREAEENLAFAKQQRRIRSRAAWLEGLLLTVRRNRNAALMIGAASILVVAVTGYFLLRRRKKSSCGGPENR